MILDRTHSFSATDLTRRGLMTTVAIAAISILPAPASAQNRATSLPAVQIEAPQPRVARTTAQRRTPAAAPRPATARAPAVREPVQIRERAEGPIRGYIASRSSTGTKTDASLLETPQSISVVTADQMTNQGVLSAGQALRYTPGVVAEPGGGNDSQQRYDFQNIRGLPYVGRHYLDGMKATFGTGNVTMPAFDPFMLERIEVLRGPASVLYGQNDPGGLINMVSKRPTATPFNEVTLSGGSFGFGQLSVDSSGRLTADDTLLYRVAALGRHSDNQVDFVQGQRVMVAPSLTWNPTIDTSLTLLSHYQHDPKGGYYSSFPEAGLLQPGAFGTIPRTRFAGDPSFDRYSRTQYSIGYIFDHRFDDMWSVRSTLRYLDSESELRALSANALIPPTTLNRSTLAASGRTSALTLDNQAKAEFATGIVHHTLLFGVDHLNADWNQFQGVGMMGVPPIDAVNPVYGQSIPSPTSFPAATLTSNGQFRQSQTGLYAQDMMKIGNVVLTAGGRYDWAETRNDRTSSLLGLIDTSVKESNSDKAFSGRVGASYLFDNGIAPYVSYSTSFQPVLGISGSGGSFKPLEGEQTEIGVKYQPLGSQTFIGLSLFDIRQKNALTLDPTPGSLCIGLAGPGPCQIQTGEMRSQGFEAEVKSRIAPNINVIASYTYLDVEVTQSNGPDLGKRPVAVPEHMGAVWADYRFDGGHLAGLTLGGGVRYVGSSFADAANLTAVPASTLFDAAMWYDLANLSPSLRGYTARLNATNLFDTPYVACAGANFCNYGLRRTVIGSLSYRW